MPSIEVGILGATGMVGQQFIALLAEHPWFKVSFLGASERSAGKAFKDVAAWRLPNRLPDDVAKRVVENAAPGNAPKLVFSGLDCRWPERSRRSSPGPDTSSCPTRATTAWSTPCRCSSPK